MKYWNNGFYDTPQPNSVEVTDEQWKAILAGQSCGKKIYTDSKGYPQLKDIVAETLEEYKIQKIRELEDYDKSSNVNEFEVYGHKMWYDKTERSALMNLANSELSRGCDDIILWTSGDNPIAICMRTLMMKEFLINIENYAKECYDNTQSHKVSINRLNTIKEVINYDIKQGYPSKLILGLK